MEESEPHAASWGDDDLVLPHAPQVRRRPARRRSVLGLCITVVSTALLLCVGVALALMLSGPVELTFVREQITRNLADAFGRDHTVDVGPVHLAVGMDGVSARLQGLTVRDLKGRAVLASPAASLSFDGGALASLRLAPKRLSIEKLALRLDISADGGVAISTSPDGQPMAAEPSGAAETPAAGSTGGAHPVVAAVTEVRRALSDGGVFGRLSGIDITDGRLIVKHQPSGRETVFENLALTQSGFGQQRQITLTADAPHGAISLRFERHAGPEGNFDRVIARDLSVSDIGSLFGQPPVPREADAPVSAQADFTLDEAKQAVTINGQVSIGASRFSVDGTPTGVISFDEAGAAFVWNSAEAVTKIADLHVISGDLSLAVSGRAEEDADARGLWRFDVAGADGKLEGAARGEPAIRLDTLGAVGSFDIAARTLVMSRVFITGPFGAATASAKSTLSAAGPSISGRLEASRAPVRDALAIWPSIIATEVRSHLVKTLLAGRLDSIAISVDMSAEDLKAAIDKRPGREAALRGDYAVSGATFTAIEGVPPLTQVNFVGQLTGRTSNVVFPRGALDLGPNRHLTVSDGSFVVPDTAKTPADGRFSMRIQGTADAAADFLGRPAVRGDGPQPLDPGNVKGNVDVRVQVALPLQPKMEKTDVQVQANGQLSNVALDKAFGKERLEALNATILSDRTGLAIKGEGRLFGAPAQIDYRKAASQQDAVVSVQAVLDEAIRAKKGLSFNNAVRGPIVASVKTTASAEGDDPKSATVSLDLTKSAIDGLVPGWSKPAGKPGKISFDLEQLDSGTRLSNLVFESGTLLAKGQVMLDADGGLRSAKLDQVRIVQGDSAKLELEKTGSGYKTAIRGNSLDVRAFLKSQNAEQKPTDLRPDAKDGDGKADGAGAEKDIDLDLKVAVLSGFNNEALTNAELRILRKGSELKDLNLNGRLNGVRVTGRMNRADRTMVFQTENAGGFMRFADIYAKMVGGDLLLVVTTDPAKQDGVLTIGNFALRGEPAFSSMSSQSRRGVNGEVEVTGATQPAGDVRFTKMRANFSREPTRITFRDGVMWGSEIGGTLSGIMDFGRDKVSMTGTFVPAYTLNNLFAQVPVLGPLLGGGSHEGLFAVAFAINGKVSAPVVSVNPLSAIAPGFLRKIFEFRNEQQEATAPSPPVDTRLQ